MLFIEEPLKSEDAAIKHLQSLNWKIRTKLVVI